MDNVKFLVVIIAYLSACAALGFASQSLSQLVLGSCVLILLFILATK